MRAALLCPGPSMKLTWGAADAGSFDTIIAVNLAMIYEPRAHWWCAGDWDTLKLFPGDPKVGICSIVDALRVAPKEMGPERWRKSWQLVPWELLPYRAGTSMPSAMGLAVYLQATHVTVFGDDKAGFTDASGTGEAIRQRGPDRWAAEAAVANEIAAKAPIEHGTTFEFVRPT